jgi:hypothetical protein
MPAGAVVSGLQIDQRFSVGLTQYKRELFHVVAHVVGLYVLLKGQFLDAVLGEIAADGDNV